jgi:hypothetical protein
VANAKLGQQLRDSFAEAKERRLRELLGNSVEDTLEFHNGKPRWTKNKKAAT